MIDERMKLYVIETFVHAGAKNVCVYLSFLFTPKKYILFLAVFKIEWLVENSQIQNKNWNI